MKRESDIDITAEFWICSEDGKLPSLAQSKIEDIVKSVAQNWDGDEKYLIQRILPHGYLDMYESEENYEVDGQSYKALVVKYTLETTEMIDEDEHPDLDLAIMKMINSSINGVASKIEKMIHVEHGREASVSVQQYFVADATSTKVRITPLTEERDYDSVKFSLY